MDYINNSKLDGKFINIDGAMKYVRHGRVRHIGTPQIYQSYGFNDPILTVGAQELQFLKPGALLPSLWPRIAWIEGAATNYLDMRELMVSVAKGSGIEIGAGPFALRVPIDCAVTYVDDFEAADQLERMWLGYAPDTVMTTDVKDSFERLEKFGDETQDFVIASHVIEHVANPIGAMVRAFEKLKPDGWLFLVVPDKRHTPDVGRPETTIDHLLQDFHYPNRERDYPHYLEYFKLAAQDANFEKTAKRYFDEGKDIHYHVWTVETFYDLVAEMRASGLTPWSQVWWRPRVVPKDVSVEFYFALQK